jgi:hypothetical protein
MNLDADDVLVPGSGGNSGRELLGSGSGGDYCSSEAEAVVIMGVDLHPSSEWSIGRVTTLALLGVRV